MFTLTEDMADQLEATRPGIAASKASHYLDILSGPGIESGNRLDVMLALLTYQSSGVFWPVFHGTWGHCDGTWRLRHRLHADLLRHHARRPGVNYLQAEARAWLDGLPDPVPVFRGCSRQRIKSVSWTVERAVAERFARGHRGIRVPSPVIASALVPKAAIFGVYVKRQEAEIVLDPGALIELTVAKAVSNRDRA